jgi:hypothetical protein
MQDIREKTKLALSLRIISIGAHCYFSHYILTVVSFPINKKKASAILSTSEVISA